MYTHNKTDHFYRVCSSWQPGGPEAGEGFHHLSLALGWCWETSNIGWIIRILSHSVWCLLAPASGASWGSQEPSCHQVSQYPHPHSAQEDNDCKIPSLPWKNSMFKTDLCLCMIRIPTLLAKLHSPRDERRSKLVTSILAALRARGALHPPTPHLLTSMSAQSEAFWMGYSDFSPRHCKR